MDFFTYLIVWVVLFAISIALQPKPKLKNARPAGLGDFSFPTATEGRSVPVVWGTVRVEGPNVTWYGDLNAVPLKKKVKTGMFSSKKQIVGYNYYIGIMFALCRGTVDMLNRVWINEKVVWEGELGGEAAVDITDPNLFGGKDQGGGIDGTFRFYVGNDTQAPNSYINNTPQDFLWIDNFGDGGDGSDGPSEVDPDDDGIGGAQPGIAFKNFKGSVGNSYWQVTNIGQTNPHGPGNTLTDDDTLIRTAPGFSEGVHLRSVIGNGVNTGDLAVYCAALRHPDRPQLNDHIKVGMAFRTFPDSIWGFGTGWLYVGCKIIDDGSADPTGIFAAVRSRSHIEVFLNTSSTGGTSSLVTLQSPGDFTEMDSGEQTLELRVVGNDIDLRLNGVSIWTDTDSRIADIGPDYTGLCVGIGGNNAHEVASPGSDWGDNGVYSFYVDSLLRNLVSDAPAYRGTCYGVWEGGYLGNSTNIQPWAFELRRCPNGISITDDMEVVNGKDANPACAIYELLTDPDWGIGFVDADIDLANFRDVGEVLFDEDNGFSFVLDSQKDAADLLKEMERQIDGITYMDRVSGKLKIKLIRPDYTLADQPAVNKTNLIRYEDFSRGAWSGTSNNVRVSFNDRAKDYGATFALAQDPANIALQGGTLINVEETYPGVKNRTLANRLAWRGLRTVAYPTAKAKLVVNRTLHFLNPGDVVRWTDVELDIDDLGMRIVKVDLGKLAEGEVVLDCVQDVFAYDNVTTLGEPPDSFWLDPAHAPTDVPVLSRRIFEAPKALCDRAEENAGTYDRIWIGARSPQDRSSRIEVWTNDAGDGYAHDADVEGYLLIGELQLDLDPDTVAGVTDLSIDCTPDTQRSIRTSIDPHTALEIGKDLYNIALIDDEFIGFKNAVNSGSRIQLQDCYRGLMDTVPTTHAAGTQVWFVGINGNITTRSFPSGHAVGVKLLPDGQYGTLDIDVASATEIDMDDRARKPYPPTNLALGLSAWASTAAIDSLAPASTVRFYSGTYTYDGIHDATAREFGQQLTFAADGYVAGVRFYKDVANTGTHVINFWDGSGNLMATKSVATETASGWQQANFDTPVPVTTGITYTASYSSTNGHATRKFGGNSGDHTANGITFKNNGGRYSAVGVFPASNDFDNSLGVDVLFASGATLDDLGLEVEYTRRDYRTTDEVKASLNEATLPATFPAANTTEYAVELVNDPAGTPATLFTTAYDDAGAIFLSRNKILRALAGAIPTDLRVNVKTHHTVDAVVYDANQNLTWDFAATSGLSGQTNLGVLPYNTGSVATYTALTTGTFTLNIGTAMASAVQVSLNGGAYANVIAGAALTGTFAVTSGDTIAVKHLTNSAGGTETFCQLLDDSDVPVAYAILTY